MKKCIVTALLICLCGFVQAAPTWQQIDFTSIVDGGVSYDADGGNVVVDGTAFYDKLQEYSFPVSVQKKGGDGINNPVSGNFAMFGIFNYDPQDAGILGWLAGNPNTTMAFELRAWGVNLDLDRDGDGDFVEHFTLNATDMPGVDYLKATFSDIAAWGCTEVAPGIWLDVALLANSRLAMSVVINGFPGKWGDVDAYLMGGSLIGPYEESGYWTPGSGIRVAAVPAPGAIMLGMMGTGLVGWLRRRRSL